jgi:two-component system, cell cycle response regulator
MRRITDRKKILIVEDNESHVLLLKAALKELSVDIQSVTSGEQALEVLNEQKFDLILLDNILPGISGIETLGFIRKKVSIPVLFVSGITDNHTIVKALEAGADDYIQKPYFLPELIARVKVRLRIKDLSDKLITANKKLEELSITDDLTGLLNMRTIYDRLDYELRRASRYRGNVSCIMLDLDYFKGVNDENDHIFGSFVLKEVGSLFKRFMRSTDFAARYGGDEFMAVIVESSESGTQKFCQRLLDLIGSHPFRSGEYSTKITASAGYCVYYPEAGVAPMEAKEFVRKADESLYLAKSEGRNRVEGVVVGEKRKLASSYSQYAKLLRKVNLGER